MRILLVMFVSVVPVVSAPVIIDAASVVVIVITVVVVIAASVVVIVIIDAGSIVIVVAVAITDVIAASVVAGSIVVVIVVVVSLIIARISGLSLLVSYILRGKGICRYRVNWVGRPGERMNRLVAHHRLDLASFFKCLNSFSQLDMLYVG